MSQQAYAIECVRPKYDTASPRKRSCGLRTAALFLGHLPILFMVIGLPIYAYSVGDVKMPDVLLSDLYAVSPAVSSIPYPAFFLIGYCLFADMALWCFSQYAQFVCRRHVKARAAAGVITRQGGAVQRPAATVS